MSGDETAGGAQAPWIAGGPPQPVTGVGGASQPRSGSKGWLVPLIVAGTLIVLLACCCGAGYWMSLEGEKSYQAEAECASRFAIALTGGDRTALSAEAPRYVADEVDPEAWDRWRTATRRSRFVAKSSEWDGDQLIVRGSIGGRSAHVRLGPDSDITRGYLNAVHVTFSEKGPWPSLVWLDSETSGPRYVSVCVYEGKEYDLVSGDLEELLEAVAEDRGADLGGKRSREATTTP